MIDFVDALGKFRKGSLKPTLVQIVTDDSKIQEEISRISEKSIEFMKPEPAPKRIPDKVRSIGLLAIKVTQYAFSKGKEEFTSIGH